MGRPSKLDERDAAEIQRRLAAGGAGNTVGELAKEFGVSKACISSRFSKRAETIKSLAVQLSTTEAAIELLPVNEQCSVRTLADQMKGIAGNLAEAANSNAEVARRLAEVARKKAQGIHELSGEEDLKGVAQLVETSNRAGSLGMGLLAANKGKDNQGVATLEDLVTGRQR